MMNDRPLDPDEAALVSFWRSLDREQRYAVLKQMKPGIRDEIIALRKVLRTVMKGGPAYWNDEMHAAYSRAKELLGDE